VVTVCSRVRKNVLPPSLVQVDAEVIWKEECVSYVGKFEEILASYGKVRGYTAYTELLGLEFFKNPAFQGQQR